MWSPPRENPRHVLVRRGYPGPWAVLGRLGPSRIVIGTFWNHLALSWGTLEFLELQWAVVRQFWDILTILDPASLDSHTPMTRPNKKGAGGREKSQWILKSSWVHTVL